MLKKLITSTLVLVVLSTASVVVYADETNELYIDEAILLEDGAIVTEIVEEKEDEIKIISPQINPENEVIAEKNLLISIKILGETSVTLSVYKVTEDLENPEVLLFDPEKIEPNDELESDYVKHITNIESGTYRMVFTKDDVEEPIKDVTFNVKKTEEVVNEEKNDSVKDLIDLGITDFFLGDE